MLRNHRIGAAARAIAAVRFPEKSRCAFIQLTAGVLESGFPSKLRFRSLGLGWPAVDCRGPGRGQSSRFLAVRRGRAMAEKMEAVGKFGASLGVQLGTCAGQDTVRLRWWPVSTLFPAPAALGPLPFWIRFYSAKSQVFGYSKEPRGLLCWCVGPYL